MTIGVRCPWPARCAYCLATAGSYHVRGCTEAGSHEDVGVEEQTAVVIELRDEMLMSHCDSCGKRMMHHDYDARDGWHCQ